MNTQDIHQVFPDYKREVISLCKSLHMQYSEDWMTLKCLEVKKNTSSSDVLLFLKSLLLSVESTQALRNLVQLFLRKITVLMEEFNILRNVEVAKQTLDIVKDFWSLVSNQHVVITHMAFGRYSPLVYEVLPSLASVYVDLFMAVHSSKGAVDKASKRLYSWLTFDLNERCIKTALLECQCTKAGSTLLIPLLRKMLSKPPANLTNLDYLLHFILLKRWAFVCVELHDLLQTHLAMKAPRNFLDWLAQQWPKLAEHLPSDKSLKGRRVSELLLELDEQAVEELIDVFSHCLWSEEQVSEKTCEQAAGLTESASAEQEMVGQLFVIDKKGNEREVLDLSENIQPSKKKRKLRHNKKDLQHSISPSYDSVNNKQSNDESDIFMLPGLMDDSISPKDCDSKKEGKQLGSCQKNESINVDNGESDVDMSEETELLNRECEQNLTYQEEENQVDFDKVSEPELSFNDSASQSYVESSNEEDDDDVIILSDSDSPASSSSVAIFSLNNSTPKLTELKDMPAMSDNDIVLIAYDSPSESKDITNRCRSSTHSKTLQSLELEGVKEIVNDEGSTNRNFERITRAQVGLVLSNIRKSMSDKRKQEEKAKTDNSFHVKTRLRNKSESTTPSGTTDMRKLRQRKTPSPAVHDSAGYLRESTSTLLKKKMSPQTAVKDTDCHNDSQRTQLLLQEKHNKQSAVKDVIAVRTSTPRSTKELTPADVLSKPYSRRDQKHSPIRSTTKASEDEESHQSRYFLRTNCSHRLHNGDAACPTCSPTKVAATPDKKH